MSRCVLRACRYDRRYASSSEIYFFFAAAGAVAALDTVLYPDIGTFIVGLALRKIILLKKITSTKTCMGTILQTSTNLFILHQYPRQQMLYLAENKDQPKTVSFFGLHILCLSLRVYIRLTMYITFITPANDNLINWEII